VESGIPYTDLRNDAVRMNQSRDPVRFVLEKSVATEPGRRFLYDSGVSIVLGEVVRKASGQAADEFAREHLFAPLGITEYRWGKLPDGTVHTGGGLWLRPRDMAKLGQLMLDGGRWRGNQIVGEAWVRDSVKQQAPYRGYGYRWWLRSFWGRDRVRKGTRRPVHRRHPRPASGLRLHRLERERADGAAVRDAATLHRARQWRTLEVIVEPCLGLACAQTDGEPIWRRHNVVLTLAERIEPSHTGL